MVRLIPRTIPVKEILRKSLHFIAGIIIVAIGLIAQKKAEIDQIKMVMMALMLTLIALDYLRIEYNLKIPIYSLFIRSKESNKLSAGVSLLLAGIICLTFYDYAIALAAISMHIFGDAVAALMGKSFGSTKIFKRKTVLGTASALVINIVVGAIILKSAYIMIAMALISTILEMIVEKLDDNFIVPIFTGLVGQAIKYI